MTTVTISPDPVKRRTRRPRPDPRAAACDHCAGTGRLPTGTRELLPCPECLPDVPNWQRQYLTRNRVAVDRLARFLTRLYENYGNVRAVVSVAVLTAPEAAFRRGWYIGDDGDLPPALEHHVRETLTGWRAERAEAAV